MDEKVLSRSWRIVGGLFMNLALGSLYAWSVFVAPLEKEFGWKRADTSLVFTWAVVVFAIAFILAGRLQDKLGPFRISLTGCILLTTGFILCMWTKTRLPPNDSLPAWSESCTGAWQLSSDTRILPTRCLSDCFNERDQRRIIFVASHAVFHDSELCFQSIFGTIRFDFLP